MKTKSKLVLGLSILSAATVAAGATSTFAWFTTSGAATASGKKAETAAIVSATKTDGVSFGVTVTVEPYRTNAGVIGQGTPAVAATEGMNLVTYSDGVKFGYIDGSNTARLQSERIGDKDYWRVYKVSVAWTHDTGKEYQTVDGQHYTDTQLYAAVLGKNFKLDIARDTDAGNVSKAKFFAATASTAEMSSGQNTLELQASTAINATNFAGEWYFGVYIDGSEHTPDSTTENGNFVVTFTQVNPPANQG